MTLVPGSWLRVGGRFELAGSVTTWSVAEGRRGRRWRTVTLDPGGSLRAMLLEVDPNRRPTRLELATARGLLVVHPERDPAALHGNVVGETGVRPITLPWSADHLLAVADEPLSVAVAIHGLGPGTQSLEAPVIIVDRTLDIAMVRWRIRRASSTAWQIEATDSGGSPRLVEIDSEGLPRAFDGLAVDASRWPLEDS